MAKYIDGFHHQRLTSGPALCLCKKCLSSDRHGQQSKIRRSGALVMRDSGHTRARPDQYLIQVCSPSSPPDRQHTSPSLPLNIPKPACLAVVDCHLPPSGFPSFLALALALALHCPPSIRRAGPGIKQCWPCIPSSSLSYCSLPSAPTRQVFTQSIRSHIAKVQQH